MGEVIINLLPVLLGATLVPIYPIIALIMLQSEGGLSKAIALMAGSVAVRLTQGILFGVVFDVATEHYSEEGSNLLVDALMLVLGILLLVKAYTTWQKEEDPEDSLPKWMSAFTNVAALKAAGIGALYVLISPKQWVFTLSAISTIGEAKLDGFSGIVLYLIYTLLTQVFVLTPVLMLVFAPQQARKPIEATYAWLAKYNQTIIMVVSLIFGIWFAYKSLSGFLT